MLKNKIYRKYYPIKKYTDLYLFEKGEQNQLINWIKIYEREIKYRNFENIIKAIKTNSIVVPMGIRTLVWVFPLFKSWDCICKYF